MVLQTVKKDTPLTILTDSANLMYVMEHCSRKERWKDFSNHPDALMIQKLAKALALRTALTRWVKIKSHTSVLLNEKADRLAAQSRDNPEAILRTFEKQDNPNRL